MMVFESDFYRLSFLRTTAITENLYRNPRECVGLQLLYYYVSISSLIGMYRLSATLISRLVLNLREQNSALVGLPTTIETERSFQAALPAAGPTSFHQNTTSVRVDKSMLGILPSDINGTSC